MKSILMITVVAAFIMSGCEKGAPMPENTVIERLKAKEKEKWAKLSERKIFFGHQSVGYNILDGIAELASKNVLPGDVIKIIETRSAADVKSGAIYHARVGKNKDPYSKCDDFKAVMESGMAGKVDAAFMKFCYVDFEYGTDYKNIFEYYKNTFDELARKYPDTKFMHFTVPLLQEAAGPKAVIKKMMGKRTDNANMERDEFNKLMRNEYGASVALFDLARYESPFSAGTCPAMLPAYTDDGGHLNEQGRAVIAGEFLLFLVQ